MLIDESTLVMRSDRRNSCEYSRWGKRAYLTPKCLIKNEIWSRWVSKILKVCGLITLNLNLSAAFGILHPYAIHTRAFSDDNRRDNRDEVIYEFDVASGQNFR